MVWEIERFMPCKEFDEWVQWLGEIKPRQYKEAVKKAEAEAKRKGRR